MSHVTTTGLFLLALALLAAALAGHVRRLNDRPRKPLGYRPPAEDFHASHD